MSDRALKAYLFYCSNNIEAGRLPALCSGRAGDTIKSISLPCSGKVDIPYLIKAFENGADGVAIVTCGREECRHFEGSARAHRRAQAVESLLEEIGVAPGRMAVFECGKDDVNEVLKEIGQFIDSLRILPPADTRTSAPKIQESTVA